MSNIFQSEHNLIYIFIKSCFKLYFSSFFETIQTLFWGFFGMVEKDRLDSLYRKHTFTMFVGLTMFGTYSTIMIIVLINMLIAMMNNSYQIIVVSKILNKC
jgi:hypothetical protein